MEAANIFWSVLAGLLSLGVARLLFLWLYGRRIEKQQRKLERLYALTEQIVVAADAESIHQKVAAAVPALADATHGYVLMARANRQQLEYIAGTDGFPSAALSLSAISGPVTCFRSEELTEVPDAENCPFLEQDVVRRFGQKSLLYAPILAGDACLGVIEVEDRKRKRNFTSEQRTLILHVAKLTALGLRLCDRRALKEQLHRTEKLTAVGELVDAMQQELAPSFERIRNLAAENPFGKNPMTLNERLHQIAATNQQAAADLERLVKFARPQRSSFRKLDLNRLLRQLEAKLQTRWQDTGLSLHLELVRTQPQIYGDAVHFEQVLLILCRHAEHFLRELGASGLRLYTTILERHVVICLTPADVPQRTLRSLARGDDEAESPASGSQLGLSICQSLIERLGGELRVDKGASRGFSIEVEYPLAEESWRAPDPHRKHEELPLRKSAPATVLVIDDDVAVQDLLVRKLSDRGYRVIPVSSAEEGIELCQQMQFPWVFCALRMQSVSGAEIYERVRYRVDQFVFLAPKDAWADAVAVEGGADRAVLRKPVRDEDLDQVLARARPSAVQSAKGESESA